MNPESYTPELRGVDLHQSMKMVRGALRENTNILKTNGQAPFDRRMARRAIRFLKIERRVLYFAIHNPKLTIAEAFEMAYPKANNKDGLGEYEAHESRAIALCHLEEDEKNAKKLHAEAQSQLKLPPHAPARSPATKFSE